MTDNQAFLIAISGIDGAGKSTQVEKTHAALLPQFPNLEWVSTHLSATHSIFRIAEEITGDPHLYDPLIPASLREFVIACDVLRFSDQVLRPALDAGTPLVWDRSPLCYEAYARSYGADLEWPLKALRFVRQPDLTILLDLDPDVAVRRLKARSDKPQQSDEQHDFLEVVRAGYLEAAAAAHNVFIVDADAPTEDVTAQILEAFRVRVGR